LWPLALEKAIRHQHETGSPDVLYHFLRGKPELMRQDAAQYTN
jgi:hypothetical protein